MDDPEKQKRISSLKKEILQLRTILVGKDKDSPENTPYLSSLSLREEELRSLTLPDSTPTLEVLDEETEFDPFLAPEEETEKENSPKEIFLLYKQNNPEILALLENNEYENHPVLYKLQEQYNRVKKGKELQGKMKILDDDIHNLKRKQDDFLREFMALQEIEYPPHTEVQDNTNHRNLIINIRAYESFAEFLTAMDTYYPKIMRLAYDKTLSVFFVKKGRASVRKAN